MKTKLDDVLQRITPLPWVSNGNEEYGDVSNAKGWVALISGSLPDVKSAQALNADYIAHAANILPELVECLDRMLADFCVADGVNVKINREHFIKRIQDAIAKAQTIEVKQ